MLQELTTATAAQAWAIGSLLFFLVVFALILLLTVGKSPEELMHCSRLPLNDDPPEPDGEAELSALPNGRGR